MSSSRFDYTCNVDFLADSSGIVGEKHYSDECKPIEMTGTYENRLLFPSILWKVKAFYRKCKCRYQNHENLKFPIFVPHDGVDIHDGPDCRYNIEEYYIQNGSKKCFKFVLICYCSRNGKATKSVKVADLM